VDRRTAAAFALAGSALLVCVSGAAADAGSGTYLAVGKAYDFALINPGSTAWRSFYLVAPEGTTFVGGTTGNEGSARCLVGQPDGTSNEIECAQLPPTLMPPQGRVAFVVTTTAPSRCGATFQLFVSSADGAPFTRVDDVTEAAGCGSLSVKLVTAPKLHGTPTVGHLITATAPVWSAASTRVRYRWERCGSSCTTITGATGKTLVLTKRDAGRAIRVVVTASVAGAAVRASSSKLPVHARRP
jgi:hypothetical protein